MANQSKKYNRIFSGDDPAAVVDNSGETVMVQPEEKLPNCVCDLCPDTPSVSECCQHDPKGNILCLGKVTQIFPIIWARRCCCKLGGWE